MNVSREFKADFDLVHAAFLCTPEEIEEAKAVARENFAAAEESFGRTAKLIRAGWRPCGEFVRPA